VNVYAGYIEKDLGVKVTVDNRSAGGAGFLAIQDALRSDQELRNAVSQAEVITIWAFWLNDLRREFSLYDADACGGEDNLDCLRKAVPPVKGAIDAVVAEVITLRSGAPTIIRIANVGNPFVAIWKKRGIFDSLKDLLIDTVSQHIMETATRWNVRAVDSYAVLNGPDGDRPLESQYLQTDGLHFNAEGHALLADLHRKVGYAPFGR
jgi:hypothetical protein